MGGEGVKSVKTKPKALGGEEQQAEDRGRGSWTSNNMDNHMGV
jgi:hypothetical protein